VLVVVDVDVDLWSCVAGEVVDGDNAGSRASIVVGPWTRIDSEVIDGGDVGSRASNVVGFSVVLSIRFVCGVTDDRDDGDRAVADGGNVGLLVRVVGDVAGDGEDIDVSTVAGFGVVSIDDISLRSLVDGKVDGNVGLRLHVSGEVIGGDDVGCDVVAGGDVGSLMCTDGGVVDDDDGNVVLILDIKVVCVDVDVADNGDGDAVAFFNVGDACNDVDAVAILGFEAITILDFEDA